MKIRKLATSWRQGNTLALTLVTTGILGFLLVAYLSLVRSQNISNMRSQSWNQAIPVIEAGIEDALTHLNNNGKSNLLRDDWSQLGNIYWMKRWLVGGNSYYLVTISNWSPTLTNCVPVIESRGFVVMPTIMAAAPGPMFASYSTPPTIKYLGRGVRAVAKRDRLFTKGMVAEGKIDLAGRNINSDSYDSTNPMWSENGRYVWWKRHDRGDIATNSGLTNSMDTGNADIWGRISTGPKGSVKIGPLGSVGDLQWHTDYRKGIKPLWSTDDMNVDFPDIDPPFTGGGFTPSAGTNEATGIRYDYYLTEGNYQLDTLSMQNNEILYVKSNATLYVTGDINISGSACIVVATNATLNLYVGGANASIGGNGVLNYSGNATNFSYWGLPSNTSLSLGGNSAFLGTIYAPYADFFMNGGGGNTTVDFSGASVTKTVRMNGNYNFHYDEALAKLGPWRRYIVIGWDEMTPKEVASGPIDTSM